MGSLLPRVDQHLMISFELLLLAAILTADGLQTPPQAELSGGRRGIDPTRMAAIAAGRAWPEALRPEWGEMLLAVLRGDMLEGRGWWGDSACRLDWKWLAAQFDADSSGDLGRDEIPQQDLFFEPLDADLDGKVTQADLTGEATKPGSGVAAALFRRLDSDANDRVSWDELSWLFQEADREKRGWISREDLENVFAKASAEHEDMPGRKRFLEMLIRGELGSFGEGPALGAAAPDFELPRKQGSLPVRLSSHRGKRPVVLIFGSFT